MVLLNGPTEWSYSMVLLNGPTGGEVFALFPPFVSREFPALHWIFTICHKIKEGQAIFPILHMKHWCMILDRESVNVLKVTHMWVKQSVAISGYQWSQSADRYPIHVTDVWRHLMRISWPSGPIPSFHLVTRDTKCC